MQNEEMDIGAAAAFLKVPKSTLKHWRATGTGPVFLKLGKRIIYESSALIEFREGCRTKQSTRKKAA